MLTDIGRPDGRDADLVRLEPTELPTIGIIDEPDVVPQAIEACRPITVEQAVPAADLVEVRVRPRVPSTENVEGLGIEQLEVLLRVGGEFGIDRTW